MVGDIYRDHLTPLGSHTATFCCFQAARDEIVDDEEEIRDPDEVHGGLDGGSEVRGDEEGGSHRSPPNVLSPLPTTRRVGDPLVDEDYEDGEDDEDDDDPFLSIPTAGGSANGRRTVSRCSVVVEIRYPLERRNGEARTPNVSAALTVNLPDHVGQRSSIRRSVAQVFSETAAAIGLPNFPDISVGDKRFLVVALMY